MLTPKQKRRLGFGAVVIVAFVLALFGCLASSANYNYCVGHKGNYEKGHTNKNGPTIVEPIIKNPTPVNLFVYCGSVVANENGSGITALATVLLTVATGLLGYLAWDQGRNSRAQLRAYVYLEGFKYELTLIDDSESGRNTELQGHLDRGLFTTRFAAQPIWKNSGATPTINLRIKIWSRIPGVFNRQVGEYEKADSGTPFFLGPQAVAGSGFIEFGGALNGAIQNGMPLQEPPPFLIWGRADYEDVFGGAHFTEWCYRVRPSRPTRDERLSVGFVQWAEYNQTDK